ncbi:unnamed protein product [Cyclocybe aegerita]|uniref:Uncharacterized protein n=1 Tax=Cyclocybe aegerita TaxID=1973307 RepID=A0A8S0Y0T9_CYCAE|nr:unnamed protein product [Cyclocybe aegerita]
MDELVKERASEARTTTTTTTSTSTSTASTLSFAPSAAFAFAFVAAAAAATATTSSSVTPPSSRPPQPKASRGIVGITRTIHLKSRKLQVPCGAAEDSSSSDRTVFRVVLQLLDRNAALSKSPG